MLRRAGRDLVYAEEVGTPVVHDDAVAGPREGVLPNRLSLRRVVIVLLQ